MNGKIDKKEFFGNIENESFADQFDRAFKDELDPELETIFDCPLPEIPNELGNDAYKDVLSSLSQLDKTGDVNVDYLEANRTRTLRVDEIQKLEEQKKAAEKRPTIFERFLHKKKWP